MGKNKILIIAGVVLLGFVLMSASGGREQDQQIDLKEKNTGGGMGASLLSGFNNILNTVQALFASIGEEEQKRLESILRSWKANNVFRGNTPYGYREFLAGRIPKADLPAYAQRVYNYNSYVWSAAAWDSKTKERVKDRYRRAAGIVQDQVDKILLEG